MTLRQRILKLVYPLFLLARRNTAKVHLIQGKPVVPPVSFYSLSVTLNNGKEFSFNNLRGKKVLLVNTASDCGYTPQYAELQKLYQHSKEDLEIIAFPANDFKEQEKGSDEEIAKFCSVNYGVSFPLAKKTMVVKNEAQHPVFRWLTSKEKNGWNDRLPSWNFAKYLVNEEGVLTHCFEPAVSPLSTEIIAAIHA
ncbi:glutathione peroxidase [Flavisolibacter ginsenosidimutans]|uniref:Glutathione peroxidase n=1 Tax=Flavisolibacter ginsenosidimutans TaxID=661481 RepID=A0A5B8UNY5_9BACT|nr:glutathione peroxidase [Flavisolibacter ginsenosidimutans]QEC57665.1 glutathione peroxidase [Flavisolibacter ginsenosidimutans]